MNYNIIYYIQFILFIYEIIDINQIYKIKIFRQNCLTYQTIASLHSTVGVRWLCVFKVARRIACDCRVKRNRNDPIFKL